MSSKFPPLPRSQVYADASKSIASQLEELAVVIQTCFTCDPKKADWNTIGEMKVVQYKLGEILMPYRGIK